MSSLPSVRQSIREHHTRADTAVLADLIAAAGFSDQWRADVSKRATAMVRAVRADGNPGLMEVFLAEYGLSTDEGIALMCLAEALLRVPDALTVDALIEDKIAPSAWGEHLGKSSSSLVNASTWALMLTGKILQDGRGVASVLKEAVKRVGEPVIRVAVSRAMKELGAQFVLGQTIDEALQRGRKKETQGYTYSYDMLGEAAMTAKDADAFYRAYAKSIKRLAAECTSDDIRRNPGISIKLSALHPRYEVGQRDRVMTELVARTLDLAQKARDAGMGLNIDAEEADRLDLSLDVIEAVLRDPSLAGWDGFGVVVQAYGKRAAPVIDWLYALASELDRKIMVRLVKGAYWDTEIKRAQVEGLSGFPVYTQKTSTDVSYICCAHRLLSMTDRIYPQFATHNAHTVAAVIEMAGDPTTFEFQRLHGMGEVLYNTLIKSNQTHCRIYAPVGAHEDLLAYLVRRLLENGANSSFVNQIVDEDVAPEEIAADPFAVEITPNRAVVAPDAIYGAERPNSKGWDLHSVDDLAQIDAAMAPFATQQWLAGPVIAGTIDATAPVAVINPAKLGDQVGQVQLATANDVATAISAAAIWDAPASERARILSRAADLYEQAFGEFFAVLVREAGKTPMDAIAELREAVDFLRYYAARGLELTAPPRGLITCISPWNFPLAIFTGQIAAALAAGNSVLAKPAEPTAITAAIGVRLLHQAGVPADALQLLPGLGSVVGAALTSDIRINAVCFTGSTATAQTINRSMAQHLAPTAPLLAETGGLNAMIVDSTALPEQAIRDVVVSAFQSSGQRCSALRMLYLQEDIAPAFLEMLSGVMDELRLGDPWDLRTDIGPVITSDARNGINAHILKAKVQGRLIKQLPVPSNGIFVGPAVIKVDGIADLESEVFGPVLHVATYKGRALDDVVAAINATGYGLTFGMHSRIDDRVEQVTQQMNAGNIYINRNQIGAIVGSQPFGGEGLSGTGPKAGGPLYVARFTRPDRVTHDADVVCAQTIGQIQAEITAAQRLQTCLSTTSLPGPTGESNRLSIYGRGVVLCLGPTPEAAQAQAQIAHAQACVPILVPGLQADVLSQLSGFDAVVLWAKDAALRPIRQSLAERPGRLIQVFAEQDLAERCVIERHICIDTTAAGGNASLLAEAA
ncbi:MAG: RHH-type proline utilization regulon transcriptional repressor/proline dehydrogenase [Paracoccaceae bacterium]|jgi:RHH-type proline utilization regulon transcriptional repressor/proline dehydrogenase/delta 1-pyrroline-5-carboxylate dehydrogenase